MTPIGIGRAPADVDAPGQARGGAEQDLADLRLDPAIVCVSHLAQAGRCSLPVARGSHGADRLAPGQDHVPREDPHRTARRRRRERDEPAPLRGPAPEGDVDPRARRPGVHSSEPLGRGAGRQGAPLQLGAPVRAPPLQHQLRRPLLHPRRPVSGRPVLLDPAPLRADPPPGEPGPRHHPGRPRGAPEEAPRPERGARARGAHPVRDPLRRDDQQPAPERPRVHVPHAARRLLLRPGQHHRPQLEWHAGLQRQPPASRQLARRQHAVSHQDRRIGHVGGAARRARHGEGQAQGRRSPCSSTPTTTAAAGRRRARGSAVTPTGRASRRRPSAPSSPRYPSSRRSW